MTSSLYSLVRDLGLHRGRERRGLTLAEGVRLVEEALAAGTVIRHVLVSPALETSARGQALKRALAAAGHQLVTVIDRELSKLSTTEQPQGVLAVVEPPHWTLSEIRPAPRRPVLVLDAVQDPGNVGTVIRTAHALGAAGVAVLPGTVELRNPKTLRATMGALFRLPCVPVEEVACLAWCREAKLRLLATATGAPLPTSADRAGALALVFGNEGSGIRAGILERADATIGIPLREGADSLNVAVAAGILLHEVTRD